MVFEFTTLNWVAVIAAAVAGVVIGGVWYLPMVFGKKWADSVGKELPTMSSMTPTQMVGVIAAPLITAYVLTLLSAGLGVASLVDGVMVGFVAWLGFSAMGALNSVMYDGRNWTWWYITAGYNLVALLAMGAIIGVMGA